MTVETSAPASATDMDAEMAPPRVASWPRRVVRQPVLWVALIDIGLIALFSLISPGHAFFKVANFTNMGLDAAEIVLLAAAVALLIGAGELDISLGANLVLSSVVGAKVCVALAGSDAEVAAGLYPHLGIAIAAGVVATILAGSLFGLGNALLVTRAGINSFIATLGTLGIGTGLALVIAGGNDVQFVPPQLQSGFGLAKVAGVPLAFIVSLVAGGVLWFLLRRTRLGLRTLALGSSREAAIRAGVPAAKTLLVLFVLVGALVGVAGFIDFSRFATTNVGGHQTDALAAIAGVVIGGGSLFGGRVSIPGAVLGALLAVILQTGLIIQGLQPFYQQIAVGTVLLIAVWIRGHARWTPDGSTQT
jgi:ribose transport system permease protein